MIYCFFFKVLESHKTINVCTILMTIQHLNAIEHFPYIHSCDVTFNPRRTLRRKNKQKKPQYCIKRLFKLYQKIKSDQREHSPAFVSDLFWQRDEKNF